MEKIIMKPANSQLYMNQGISIPHNNAFMDDLPNKSKSC